MDENKPKLLQEFFILESVRDSDKGPRKLRGVFSVCEEKNQNGRFYPRRIMEREVNKFMNCVKERRAGAVGELDHPDVSVVQLANASHVITDLKWEGNNLIGEIEILPTKNGQTLEALVEAGIKPGISSRAVGSTVRSNEGVEMVQDDLQLLTFDVVSNPSVSTAILSENLQILREVKYSNQIYTINSIIDDILNAR
jgi:hypothetical protein